MKLVKIPQYVAEWIELHKQDYIRWDENAKGDFIIRCSNDLFNYGEHGVTIDFEVNNDISKYTCDNPYTFIRAIMDGYEIEKY